MEDIRKEKRMMKKHTLLALLPFALVITGCSGNLQKASIFNKKFLRMNTAKLEGKYEYENESEVVLDIGSDITPTQHATFEQILELEKADGSQGYFDLVTKKVTLPVEKWKALSLGVEDVDDSGLQAKFFTAVKEENGKDVRYVYDEYANLIYSGLDGALTIDAEGDYDYAVNDYLTSRAVVSVDNRIVAYASYSFDGSFIEALTVEEYLAKYPYAHMGTNLRRYGHKELVEKTVSNNGEERHYVFNTKKGKSASTFSIPTKYIINNEEKNVVKFKVGNYYFYQILKEVQEREKKYDFALKNEKFNVETYRVNYLNGKVNKVKTNLLFSTFKSTKALVNNKGVAKYFSVQETQSFDKDKTINPIKRNLILNENLKVVADVSGISISGLVQFGDYYYSLSHVYDTKLREVGYISSANINDPHIASVRNAGGTFYGLVDHTGKYLVKPIYKAINRIGNEGNYEIVKDNERQYVKINEKEQLETVTTISLDEYKIDKATSSQAHKIFEKVSDSKHYALNMIDGSFTPVYEPQAGDSDVCLADSIGALNYTISMDAHVFKRGSEYRALYTTTHEVRSIPKYYRVK